LQDVRGLGGRNCGKMQYKQPEKQPPKKPIHDFKLMHGIRKLLSFEMGQ
jgi:hypothetical protein